MSTFDYLTKNTGNSHNHDTTITQLDATNFVDSLIDAYSIKREEKDNITPTVDYDCSESRMKTLFSQARNSASLPLSSRAIRTGTPNENRQKVPYPWILDNDNRIWTVDEKSTTINNQVTNNELLEQPRGCSQYNYNSWMKPTEGADMLTATSLRSTKPFITCTKMKARQLRKSRPPRVIILFSSLLLNEDYYKSTEQDNVSELNSNPDVDDDDVLPQPTIDVLKIFFEDIEYDTEDSSFDSSCWSTCS